MSWRNSGLGPMSLSLVLILQPSAPGSSAQHEGSVRADTAAASGRGIAPERDWLEAGPGPAFPHGAAAHSPAASLAAVGTEGAGTQSPAAVQQDSQPDFSAHVLSTTSLDSDFVGLRGTAQPSDGTLAVGRSNVLQIVNGE